MMIDLEVRKVVRRKQSMAGKWFDFTSTDVYLFGTVVVKTMKVFFQAQ